MRQNSQFEHGKEGHKEKQMRGGERKTDRETVCVF